MPDRQLCRTPSELEQYVNQILPAEDVEAFAGHLEQCERCAEIVDEILSRNKLAEAAPWEAAVDTLPTAVPSLLERIHGMQPPTTAPMAPRRSSPGFDPRDLLAPPQEDDEIGRLGGYRVLKVLGAGGMGVVFQAEDVQLRRLVALKVMRPDLVGVAENVQRFLREARSAAAIEHDHIVAIYQVGEDRGVAFLAMQYLHGESLEDRLRRQPKLPLNESLRIGREIARGLAAAHQRGLIHRDIKPANLWLEARTGRIKILDFGLARSLADDGQLTESGAIIGTPAYMAPEQVVDEQVDHRCDLFSLGCVLYRLLTGVPAFQGKNTLAILRAIELEHPKPPHEINSEIPARLSNLVLRLLAKQPQDRPHSAEFVAESLQAIEQEIVANISAPVGLPSPFVERGSDRAREAATLRKRRRSSTLLAGVICTVALFGVGVLLLTTVEFWSNPTTSSKMSVKNSPAAAPASGTNTHHMSESEPSVTKSSSPGSNQEKAQLPSWPLIGELGPHTAQINSLAITSDSELVAVGCGSYWEPHAPGVVRLWNLTTQKEAGAITEHSGGVTCVAFASSRYKEILAAATGNMMEPKRGEVRLWNVATQKLAAVISGFEQGVFSIAFSPNGALLATAGAHRNRTLTVWSVEKLLAKTSGAPPVWDQESGAREQLFTDLPGNLSTVAFSPNGKLLAVGAGGGVKVWSTENWSKQMWLSLDPSCGQVQSIAFSADGDRLAAATSIFGVANKQASPVVSVWNLTIPGDKPNCIACIAHIANFAQVAFTRDGRYVVTGDQDGGVWVWDVSTGVGRALPYTHQDWVFGLAISNDGETLVTGASDPTVKVWRISEGGAPP